MRRIYLKCIGLICTMFLCTALFGQTWYPQATNTTQVLEDVHFINDLEGWAVGAMGTIIHTADGGCTWVSQSLAITNKFNGVHFMDNQNGVAVGTGGVIYRTFNGGNTWFQIANPDPNLFILNSVHFANNVNGWAVGQGGTILRTTNGGVSWTQQTAPGSGGTLHSVHAFSGTLAWACGSSGYGIRTTNGTTWSTMATGTAGHLYTIFFPPGANTTGWICGGGGRILQTTNGGATWTAQTSGVTTTLHSIVFDNILNGWSVGDGGILLNTTNGGASWTVQNSGTGSSLRGIDHGVNEKWAVGASGTGIATIQCCSGVPICNPTDPIQPMYHKYFGLLSSNERGFDFKQTENGGYIFTGTTDRNQGQGLDVFLTQTDRNGEVCWTQTFNGFYNLDDAAYAVRQTSDCGFILAGSSFRGTDENLWLIKTDENGVHQWNLLYAGDFAERAYDVIELQNGDFLAVGFTRSFGSVPGVTTDMFAVRCDANGNQVWEYTYGTDHDDTAFAVIENVQGGFSLTGVTNAPTPIGGDNIYTVRTQPTGVAIWSRIYGREDDDIGYDIVEDPVTRNLFVTGESDEASDGNPELCFLKMDPFGNFLEFVTYGGFTDDGGYAIMHRPSDDHIFMTGYTRSFGAGNQDLFLIETSIDGSFINGYAFGRALNEVGHEVIETDLGNIAMGGFTNTFGCPLVHEAYFIKLNSGLSGCFEQTVTPNIRNYQLHFFQSHVDIRQRLDIFGQIFSSTKLDFTTRDCFDVIPSCKAAYVTEKYACEGACMTLAATLKDAASYEWYYYNEAGSRIVQGMEAEYCFKATESRTYFVDVPESESGEILTESFRVNLKPQGSANCGSGRSENCCGVQDVYQAITLSPNPARDYVTVTYDLPATEVPTVTLFDLQGKKVELIIHQANTTSMTIETTDLTSGIYLLEVSDGSRTLDRQKLVISH